MKTKAKRHLIPSLISGVFFMFSMMSHAAAVDPASAAFFVAPGGNDAWSGRLESPAGDDGPFATLARARQAAREAIAKGLTDDLTVLIRGGRYELDRPLVFSALDSGDGHHAVTWAAYPGEQPLLSGGRILKGQWQKLDSNIWALDIEGGNQAVPWFRDLYADDRRMTRSRFPNEGEELLRVSSLPDGEEGSAYELNGPFPGGNLVTKDAELVMYQIWSSSRGQIVSSAGNTVSTRYPLGWIGHNLTTAAPGRRVYLEHAREFIDRPGEWYYDRDAGRLYFMADEGEDPSAREFTVPMIEKLLIVKGGKASPVRNLHFKGLRFEHTSWQLPFNGYSGIQAGHYGSKYITEPTLALPLAVELEYLEDSSFEGCRVAHTGAGGLAFGAGCRGNRVNGCEFIDVGGNGVMVGWRRRADDPPRHFFENDWDDPTDAPAFIDVSHNRLIRCGAVQKGCVGLFVAFSADVSLTHNEIADLPYSGISLGYIWGDEPTTMMRCTVAYNHIHHVMKDVFDGAGVYTLGYQPGTVIHHNFIHDVMRGHGMYTDEGSSHLLWENNVILRVAGWGYQHHYGSRNTLRNNIICAVGRNYVVRCKEDPAESFNFERNIVLMDGQQYLKQAPWFSESLLDDFNEFWHAPTGTLLFGAWGNGQFRMDNNLYWSLDGKEPQFNGGSLTQWRSMGQDTHSVVADPKLADPQAGDFSLAADSPALALGFKPIDLSRIGPQGTYAALLPGVAPAR